MTKILTLTIILEIALMFFVFKLAGQIQDHNSRQVKIEAQVYELQVINEGCLCLEIQ